MPLTTPTFRVFVSSTFDDLEEERDALQRETFPKLRRLCEQHGARFQAIDLRWGIRNEAALDQQTMDVCMREIRHCQRTGFRPNFIVLMGDRYGWRPLPSRIVAAEFGALTPFLRATNTETLARRWYRLDENALPPEYCLQARTGEFIDPHVWRKTEEALLVALEYAARRAALAERELLKYETSATHQEIAAGLPEVDLEHGNVLAFFRRPSSNGDWRLNRLKSYLHERIPDAIFEFDSGDTQSLCNIAFHHLQQIITGQVKQWEQRPALHQDLGVDDDFAEERCRTFAGRERILDAISSYIEGSDCRPLVIRGESGSGKSTVMAKASQEYAGTARLIRRFVGVSPQSATGFALLTGLCRELEPGLDPDELPAAYAQIENKFLDIVEKTVRPVVLFIDAVDQLPQDDPARLFHWLALDLPPHVKAIVSATPDIKGLPQDNELHLAALTRSEGAWALESYLRDASRTLRPWQRARVLQCFERCGLPLYLKLAVEECRLWRSYASADECVLGDGIPGIIDTLLDRLASNVNHGRLLVARSLGYFAAARYGLTEGEIIDLLSNDDAVWTDFERVRHHAVSERLLPVVVWSRLALDLEPYLTERNAPGGTVLSFYHRQLTEVVTDRFLNGSERDVCHKALAQHFAGEPMWLDAARVKANARKAVELTYHLARSQQWKDAEATLVDAQFLAAKSAAYLLDDLDADFAAVLRDSNELRDRETLELIHSALRLSLPVVSRDPIQFTSQMFGRLMGHRDKPAIEKFASEVAASARRPWLRLLQPALIPAGTRLLRTFDQYAQALAVTADGKRLFFSSGPTYGLIDLDTGHLLSLFRWQTDNDPFLHFDLAAVTPDGRTAVFADREGLKVWNLDSGEEIKSIRADSNAPARIGVSSDGRTAVSGSFDGKIIVWDLDTGQTLQTFEDAGSVINALAVTSDRRWAISADKGASIKVWDIANGGAPRMLAGHKYGEVRVLAITPDGKRLVSAAGMDLRVWDLSFGGTIRKFRRHSHIILSAAVSFDGKRVVSGCFDTTIRVCDLATGRRLLTLEGHAAGVNALTFTPDGMRAVSGSEDNTIKVWDLRPGKASPNADRHSPPVTSIAVAREANRAISVCDSYLKLWDATTGRLIRSLYSGMSLAKDVAVTSNGRLAVCASYRSVYVLPANITRLGMWLGILRSVVLRRREGWAFHEMKGHSANVNSVAMHPNGKTTVSASDDKTIKLWDLSTAREIRTFEGHLEAVNSVAITRDGKQVVSGSKDKTIKTWDLATGRELHSIDGHSNEISGLAVASGGKLISWSHYGSVRVWDLASRTQIDMHGIRSVEDLALSPDGKRIVTARGSAVTVFDLDTWIVIARFHCEGDAKCCEFGSDQTVVAGDAGGRIYFLKLEEMRQSSVHKEHALAVLDAAYEKQKRHLGENHDDTVMAETKFAVGLAELGFFKDAEPLFRHALEFQRQKLGNSHPATLLAMQNLAFALSGIGDYSVAEVLFMEAIDGLERVSGRDHANTLLAMFNLAEMFRTKGDLTRAEPLYRNVLEARARVLGRDHAATVVCANNLAATLQLQGKYDEAEALYRRALEAQTRRLGNEHPETLTELHNLAAALTLKGEFDRAEPLLRQAIEAQERVLGKEHPSTLVTVISLAELLKRKGDYSGADKLFRRAVTVLETVAPDHPMTKAVAENYRKLLQKKK